MINDKREAEAIATARAEIAKRIARYCTSLSPDELDILLDRMANVQRKYQMMPVNSEPAEPARQIRKLLE